MKRLALVGAFAFAFTLLAACSKSGQSGVEHTEGAPDFQIAAYQGADVLGGKDVLFSAVVAQGKPVVLNFWAGACAPCRQEIPHFREMYEERKDSVLVFGLDVGPFVGLGTRKDGMALMEELGVQYPVGSTSDAEVLRNYRILGMPTTVFIKPDGQIQRSWTGILTKEKLDELVDDLLSTSKGNS